MSTKKNTRRKSTGKKRRKSMRRKSMRRISTGKKRRKSMRMKSMRRKSRKSNNDYETSLEKSFRETFKLNKSLNEIDKKRRERGLGPEFSPFEGMTPEEAQEEYMRLVNLKPMVKSMVKPKKKSLFSWV